MKKLVLLISLAFSMVQTVTINKTVGEVLDEIALYEGFSAEEKADLRNKLFAANGHYLRDGSNAIFNLNITDLRIIKPFIKKKKNPLFAQWVIDATSDTDGSVIDPAYNNYDKLVRFLVTELGADVNFIAANGMGALHCAVERRGDIRIIECLLQLGADTELLGYGREQVTPLGGMARRVVYGTRDYVTGERIEALLRYGARLDVVDSQGNDFFQLLDNWYNELSAAEDHAENIKSTVPARRLERMEAIKELPAVAQAMDQVIYNRNQQLVPFLPGEHGIVDLVVDYTQSESLSEYREQKRYAQSKQGRVFQQAPYLADIVGDELPWEVEQER